MPAWRPLDELHPCDLQSSMLKGCTPADGDADFYSVDRRRRIRRICAPSESRARTLPIARALPARRETDRSPLAAVSDLAMIAEFDAMVGEYVSTVEDAGVTASTVFIVTSDHGDMQMEHQQFYKMVRPTTPPSTSHTLTHHPIPHLLPTQSPHALSSRPLPPSLHSLPLPQVPYDASASVPMVVSDGRHPYATTVRSTTQLIDIYPTIMDLAEVPAAKRPAKLDGTSMLRLFQPPGAAAAAPPERPPFVVSQFHGDNIAMSWFLIVQVVDGAAYKLVRWGTGAESPSMLFNISADPDENANLLGAPGGAPAREDARRQPALGGRLPRRRARRRALRAGVLPLVAGQGGQGVEGRDARQGAALGPRVGERAGGPVPGDRRVARGGAQGDAVPRLAPVAQEEQRRRAADARAAHDVRHHLREQRLMRARAPPPLLTRPLARPRSCRVPTPAPPPFCTPRARHLVLE